MLVPKRLPTAGRLQHVAQTRAFTSSPATQYGRTAVYRRIVSKVTSPELSNSHLLAALAQSNTFSRIKLSSRHSAHLPAHRNQPSLRPLHTSTTRWQQAQPKEDVRDPPREESTSKAEESESAKPSSESEGKEETSESDSKEKKEENKETPPAPPHGDKTPWQVFRDTLQTEFKASKEWNESTKQLASSANQFTESEGVRRARAAQQAATSSTAKAIKGTAKAVGAGAAWTWETPVVQGLRAGVNATGRGIEKATRPIRETETFKNVKDAVDDGSSSRYGGWVEKEERKRKRELRELKEMKGGRRPIEKMEEDPNAGTNITLHKDSAFKEAWTNFKDNSKLMQGLGSMKNTYEESENPLISTARSITDRIAGFFAENETAMVIKKFREMDPNFQIEPFLRDMREYILPEVLDAYVKGDVETLKLWLSAAQFQVYSALMQQYTTAGLKSDGRILDIRGVDILNARILEPGEIPVFIITCRTQEVHVYRNKKTNELAAGMEDRVQLVTYAIGVTRLPEEVNNPETRGWRMIELQKAGRDYI